MEILFRADHPICWDRCGRGRRLAALAVLWGKEGVQHLVFQFGQLWRLSSPAAPLKASGRAASVKPPERAGGKQRERERERERVKSLCSWVMHASTTRTFSLFFLLQLSCSSFRNPPTPTLSHSLLPSSHTVCPFASPPTPHPTPPWLSVV